MTPELIERVARAICGMPSCGAPKCPCGFAYDQMDAARAALDAIKAAGWTLYPPEVASTPEDVAAWKVALDRAIQKIRPTDTPFLRSLRERETD